MNRIRFYYETKNSPSQITYAIKDCKRPRQTAAYKNLMLMLDLEHVRGIGYHTISEEYKTQI
jgi:hypothetical protein